VTVKPKAFHFSTNGSMGMTSLDGPWSDHLWALLMLVVHSPASRAARP
jgi:hypothetical protein